ncbi:hypothetical protein MASR2M70_11180 [Bacillota bacterium]
MDSELMGNKLMNKFIFENDFYANVSLMDIQFIPIQMNDGIKLIHVIEGEIRVKVSFNSYDLALDDFLLINPFEVHSIEGITKTNKVIVMELDLSLLENRLFAFDISFYRDHNAEIVTRVKKLMTLAYKRSQHSIMDEKNTDIDMEKVLEEIAGICDQYFQMEKYRMETKTVSPFSNHLIHNERMKKTYEYFYIDRESPKRLDTLSEMMNIDKCYASRLIKSGMGSSFQEILNITRVERAELLLLGTDLSIQNISEKLNFSSTYHFDKAFRQYFGMNPQTYRKIFKSKTYPIASGKYRLIKYEEDQHLTIDNIIQYLQNLHKHLLKGEEIVIESKNYKVMYDSLEHSIVITDAFDNCIMKLLIPEEISKNTQ